VAAFKEEPGTLGKVLSTVNVIGRFVSGFLATPWLLDPDAGGFSCASQDDPDEFGNTIWLCQILCGPTRGAFVVAAAWKDWKPAGRVGDVTLTLWGFAHFGMVVALAVAQGSSKTIQAVSNSLTTFAPQMLRFAALPEWAKTKYGAVVPAALIVLIVFTYPAITALNILGQDEDEDMARLQLALASA